MENEFIPYEEALALKELGFDELCFGLFDMRGKFIVKPFANQTMSENEFGGCSAPLYQQAFRWFREKYKINAWVFIECLEIRFQIQKQNGELLYVYPSNEELFGDMEEFILIEEAELACLRKLIKTVKNKK